MKQIVTDIDFLRQVSVPVETVNECLNIISDLEKTLVKIDYGLGLSAIQIGINKRVAIIKRQNGFLHLINPKILTQEDKFLFFEEGCLSFPDQWFNVFRYRHFIIENNRIENDRFETEQLYFYYPSQTDKVNFCSGNELESIAVQHEMDHFDGKLCIDNHNRSEPIVKGEKVGRNSPCPCGSGKKYKKYCGQ